MPHFRSWMKLIPLTQGKHAIVDDEDYEWVSRFKWYLFAYIRNRNLCYAVRNGLVSRGEKRGMISLHRSILVASPGEVVDHINGNTLDDRRSNLRKTDKTGNNRNRMKTPSSSRFKGASWHKPTERWRSSITLKNKTIHLGMFDSEEQAALCYDAKARELFGQFAALNFPKENERGCLSL